MLTIALPVDACRIGQCVGFHAARRPEHEAAVHGAKRLAYCHLDRAMAGWARALLAVGVTHGDRIASLTPPSIEWLAIMLGTTEIGAIWTGCHPRYRMPEFRPVIQLAEPSVLVAFRRIHDRDYAEELTALKADNPSLRHLVLLDEPLPGGIIASEFLANGDAVPQNTLETARSAVRRDDTAVLNLYLRHHRPAQGGHDQASSAPHRGGGREQALADAPAAGAPHDAGQPHRGRRDDCVFRSKPIIHSSRCRSLIPVPCRSLFGWSLERWEGSEQRS